MQPESSLTVTVAVSPAVLKISQGLVHTLSLTLHAWRPTITFMRGIYGAHKLDGVTEIEKSRSLESTCVTAVSLPGYFVVCNDTNQDLIIGQVSLFLFLLYYFKVTLMELQF